jgi:hypothetical protein
MLAKRRSTHNQSMQTDYLLVWFKGGEALAARFVKLPDVLVYEGKTFRAMAEYLGDVDYLRDRQNRLVGFSYILGSESEQEEALHESFIIQSKSVKRHDGMLILLFQPIAFEIECVQAVGSQIYRSSTNELMLAIPDCGFGDLAFRLTTTEIPTSAVPNH